jgi:aminoglycoside 3-N-acetyltransferase
MAPDIFEELVESWLSSGIEEGDMVLLHSSTKRLFRRFIQKKQRPDPEIILQSFLEAVGKKGTLLLPLFNFDFAKGIPFDISSTPSRMGTLTEIARKRPGVVRTGHPIYSFAVLGAEAERFVGLENFSGYGDDSPFAVLHQNQGKIAILDLSDQDSVTFYHYVEEHENVPYRHHKVFEVPYTDASGVQSLREFGLFVRNLDEGVKTHVNPMGERLWSAGLYQGSRPGEENGLRTISASSLFAATTEVIRGGKAEGLLYRLASSNDINAE